MSTPVRRFPTARHRHWNRYGVFLGVGAALLVAQLCPPTLHAAPTVENLRYILDIDSDAIGTLLEDHRVTDQSFVVASGPTSQDLGVPATAAIDAYVLLDDGSQVVSVDTTVELGGLLVEPGDLVRFDDGVWSLEADASALGLTSSANLDAATWIAGGYLVSFDLTLELQTVDAGTLIVDDDDLVRLEDAGFTALAFDGSAAGVPSAADLDAVWAFENSYYVSFDISGVIDGMSFDDEDLLVVGSDGTGWAMSGDIDALFLFLQGGFDMQAVHYKVSETPLFCDGFESGDASAWNNF